MAFERTEQRVVVDGASGDLDSAIDRAKSSMVGDGWTFSYQKPVVADGGEPLDDAVDLCFWRSGADDGDERSADSLGVVAEERPENWTKA